jgi:hamartin protein
VKLFNKQNQFLIYLKQHADIFIKICNLFDNFQFKHILVNFYFHLYLYLYFLLDSLDNVQLWIVNQSAHALFYTLYTAYPCNFLYQIQREFQRNENPEVFEHIFIPMFQRVRFNPRLIESDRKRELDKDKRLRHDSYNIIYEARKLSLDPLFGRESPANNNWMHQEMKKILPFYQFKRKKNDK